MKADSGKLLAETFTSETNENLEYRMRRITSPSIPLAAALALCLATTSAWARQDPCLSSPLFSGNVVIPMPARPGQPHVPMDAQSSVTGDFDGDGRLDLILGSNYGSLVYYRGRGHWWDFQPPVITNLPFAQPPSVFGWSIKSLAAADFNGDGDLDLAVGDEEYFGGPLLQRVHIMLGNGDGTFQPGVAYGPILQLVYAIKVADFNGDGNLDLMCAVRQTHVAVLWGGGDGTFPTFSQVSTGPYSDGVSVADIDHDNDMDAVVDNTQSADVVLRNNGDGTFAAESFVAVAGGFGHMFGELNGDGWADMVLAHTGGFNESIYALFNDGAGHFPSALQYPLTAHPGQSLTGCAPLVADLDGDGRDEVIIGRRTSCSATESNDQMLVFHNDGSGTLEPPVLHHYAVYSSFLSNPRPLTAVDLNGDARLDVIECGEFGAALLINDSDGGFLTAHGTPMGPSIVGNCGYGTHTDFKLLTRADVNGDGRFDLVGVREGTYGDPPDPNASFLECTVMLQDAQGAFTTLSSVPLVERTSRGVALADFNRDGDLDLAVSTQPASPPGAGNAVRIGMGNGDGAFQPWVTYASGGGPVLAGDLNGDLWPDLVVGGQLGVLLNNGDGTFAPVTPYVSAWAFALADLNGDTWLDVAFLSDGIRVLLNNGNGTFSLSPHLTTLNASGTEITCADVNIDGFPDALVYYPHVPGLASHPGGVAVALNDGDGTFTFASTVNPGGDYRYPTAADLDSDGNPDLVTIAPPATGPKHLGIVVNFGHGNGTFGQAISYAGASGNGGNQRPIIMDWDNDGRLDIGVPMGGSPDWDLATHLGFSILLNRTCPAPESCPADIDNSGSVDVDDLIAVILGWGPCGKSCSADIDDSGAVDIDDLIAVILAWGACD